MTLRFEKWEGLGNDYLLVDRTEFGERDPKSWTVRWSDRNYGVGSDGLILVDEHPLSMRIFNADGSEGANVWQWHSGRGGPGCAEKLSCGRAWCPPNAVIAGAKC